MAILESRGYCNIVEAATNVELDIAAGVDATVAFNAAPSVNPVSHWGILQVPAGTSKAHQRMWTTRNTFPVAAGTSYARGLFARHQFGAQNGNCGGTFAVSFAGGTLP